MKRTKPNLLFSFSGALFGCHTTVCTSSGVPNFFQVDVSLLSVKMVSVLVYVFTYCTPHKMPAIRKYTVMHPPPKLFLVYSTMHVGRKPLV